MRRQGEKLNRHRGAEIVATINKEINAGLADTKIKARIIELASMPPRSCGGATVMNGGPPS
jgi:hypothetical protein